MQKVTALIIKEVTLTEQLQFSSTVLMVTQYIITIINNMKRRQKVSEVRNITNPLEGETKAHGG